MIGASQCCHALYSILCKMCVLEVLLAFKLHRFFIKIAYKFPTMALNTWCTHLRYCIQCEVYSWKQKLHSVKRILYTRIIEKTFFTIYTCLLRCHRYCWFTSSSLVPILIVGSSRHHWFTSSSLTAMLSLFPAMDITWYCHHWFRSLSLIPIVGVLSRCHHWL